VDLFDFESAENEELRPQPIRERGDTLRALIDERWLNLAIIILVIAIVAQIRELLAMVAFMLVVVFVSWAWSRNSLRGLVYERRFHFRRYFPGETIEAQIMVENRKLLPLPWLQIEDAWPLRIAPLDDSTLSRVENDPDYGYLINTYALRWYERVRRRYALQARCRGVFEIGPVSLVSGDPFSLFDRKIALEKRHDILIVYPRTRTLAELGLPLKDPFGDRPVQQPLFEDPSRTMGVREYSPRDSFRHIHWNATARTGSLQTRVYEPTRSLRTVLCLNVATFEQYWRGVWPDMLEYEMEVAASLAKWGLEQGHSVGMAANGTLAHADQPFRIPPSRNLNQLPRILEALAAVSYFVSSSFDRFLIEESPRIPWGATLVLITPFVNEDIAASVLRLRDSGRRLVLISLGKAEPSSIQGVLTYHLPIAEEEPPLPPEDDTLGGEPSAPDSVDLLPRQRFLLGLARQEETDRGGSASHHSTA